MDRVTGILADGLAAAAAASGILTQQQARIFGLLYLADHPLSLDEIAAELSQSKSNVSVNIRVLVEWHLVKRRPVPGSRRDHYEAATDFFRAMQEIFERRFRWTVRQVMAAATEARAAAADSPRSERSDAEGAPRAPRGLLLAGGCGDRCLRARRSVPRREAPERGSRREGAPHPEVKPYSNARETR